MTAPDEPAGPGNDDVASPDGPTGITMTRAQLRFASWTTDVLVYTVVLNLFVEYADAVVIDSFTISVLTAVLLKALLDAILRLEHAVGGWFADHGGRVLSVASTLAILFLSKFVILEAVDLVFGEDVELGGLIEVVLLVISLMVSRQIFAWIFNRLGSGEDDGATSDSASG